MALSASFLCSSSRLSSSVCLSQQLQRPPAGLCAWKEKGTGSSHGDGDGGLNDFCLLSLVECSSRPQKKCTAHHNKTRPKKHSPYEKNRKPAFYPRLPKPPPLFVLGWDPLPQDQPLPTYNQFNCTITPASSSSSSSSQ